MSEVYFSHKALQNAGRPVTYYPVIAAAFGDLGVAIFLSNFFYWEGKQKDSDGWIYKSRKEISQETGLTRSMQERVRKKLVEKGMLDEKLAGSPATKHFKFNWTKVDEFLSDYIQHHDVFEGQKEARTPNLVFEMKETFLQKYHDHYDINYEWRETVDWSKMKKLKEIFGDRQRDRNKKDRLPDNQLEPTKEQILTSFDMFLDALPEFHRKRNFTPSLLVKHFNNIIMDIVNESKSNSKKTSQGGSDIAGQRPTIGSTAN